MSADLSDVISEKSVVRKVLRTGNLRPGGFPLRVAHVDAEGRDALLEVGRSPHFVEIPRPSIFGRELPVPTVTTIMVTPESLKEIGRAFLEMGAALGDMQR